MGKLSKMPLAEKWAQKIKAQQAHSVESLIEIGRLLLQAKSDLTFGEWGRLFDEGLIDFSQRTAQRFMEIAGHPLLSNATHGSYLPPSWRTLHELTKVEEPILKNAIKDGVITPEFQRKDVKALLPPKPKPEPEPFHWMNAIGDLKDTVERVIAKWPDDARSLAPKALRDLADALESEQVDVDRGEGHNGSGSGGDSVVENHGPVPVPEGVGA